VAGIRTPKHIDELNEDMPEIYSNSFKCRQAWNATIGDMQTWNYSRARKLGMLQTRNGKRTGPAASESRRKWHAKD